MIWVQDFIPLHLWEDGQRFLVDRLWPRGLKREDLKIEGVDQGCGTQPCLSVTGMGMTLINGASSTNAISPSWMTRQIPGNLC